MVTEKQALFMLDMELKMLSKFKEYEKNHNDKAAHIYVQRTEARIETLKMILDY